MINWLHSKLHRPEQGWDPVPLEHAREYGRLQWNDVNESVLDQLDDWLGGLKGKRVLDLGGGPAQYAVAFARRGAQVTWFDVSRNYQDLAKAKAAEFHLADRIQFTLGYLDEAPRLLTEPYDLVFNRICWNYGQTDRSFADMVYRLVRPGGSGYVDTTNSIFNADQLSPSARARTWLNDTTSIKIGHPYPPRGRVAKLLQRHPLARLLVDYSADYTDRVFFQKPRPAP
ncbi:MAG: methyltransferase domain-containing protein [Ramlibacter sp.]